MKPCKDILAVNFKFQTVKFDKDKNHMNYYDQIYFLSINVSWTKNGKHQLKLELFPCSKR